MAKQKPEGPLRLSQSSSRLIPRDISESLGKLPPQALEMEESVLGALMIDKSALAVVRSYLKPDHFYKESHVEIYTAILALDHAGDPVDMRSVSNQLKKTGKIELVGGMYYIAELTTKASGSANIDYHARVIVEMGMKREMIQLASRIHEKAYEDTTDVFRLLESTIGDFQYLEAETTKNTEGRIRVIWDETIVATKPPPQIPVVRIQNINVLTRGNHSLITGKQKSRKSLFIVQLICWAIQEGLHPDEILPFDTEQERADVWEMRDRVYRVTGCYVNFFSLRGKSFMERREIITQTVLHWKRPPVLAIIDGVRDLMSNINDPDEATEVVGMIEKLTTAHNLHIVDVLHLNKTNGDARGHIGTELLNKAEINIELEYDDKSGMTEVKCASSRRQPFQSFMFTHGPQGLPDVVGQKVNEEVVTTVDQVRNLELIFTDGPLGYAELVDGIKAYFSCGQNKAKQWVAQFTRQGYLVKSGPAKSKSTMYKLITVTPTVPAPPMDLFTDPEPIEQPHDDAPSDILPF